MLPLRYVKMATKSMKRKSLYDVKLTVSSFIHALYRADDLKDSIGRRNQSVEGLEILKEGGSKLWDYSISYSERIKRFHGCMT